MAAFTIVSLAAAPGHLDTLARWNHSEWGAPNGRPLQKSVERLREIVGKPSEECVVALDGDTPAGMACLVDHDLPERPDLQHWLASVYVHPQYRRRGLAAKLVGAVERAALDRGLPRLHLFTNTAEALYAGLGWVLAERFRRGEREFALMLREPMP